MRISQTCTKTIYKPRQKHTSCAVLLDLRKTYDSVNHTMVLTKLEHYGVRVNTFKHVQSYLFGRKQYVRGGNTKSSIKSIIAGLSHDWILGAIFFLLFINDLPSSNLIKFILFADDAVLVQSDNNLGKLQNLVNFGMTNVMDWILNAEYL